MIITASPRYESSVSATWGVGLVGTGFDIFPVRETTGIGDDTLTCHDIVVVGAGLAGCHSEGSDTVGITECDYPEACQHGDAGVCTFGLCHKSANGLEYILLINPELARLLEIIGEDVEQKLGIGRGVDMTVGVSIHEVEQGICIDKVTVLSAHWARQNRGVNLRKICYIIRVCSHGRIRCHMES